MKIVMGGTSDAVHVYDNSGKDITADLGIQYMNVSIEAGGMTKVEMTCFAEVVEIDGAEVNLFKSDNYVKMPPSTTSGILQAMKELKTSQSKSKKPAEAILKSFKIKKAEADTLE